MELWSAFLIGMAGSLHCAGMCGAFAVALPPESKGRFSFISGRMLYNAGRILSYISLGLFFGVFGTTALLLGLQQNVSVMLGVIIILLVIMPGRFRNKLSKLALFEFYNKKLQSYTGKVLKKNSLLSLLLLGMLNGLLPCGMVYMALAGAVASAGLKNAMVYMALFGLGTLPVMVTVSFMGRYIAIGLRSKLSRIVPLLALALGAVFILRGMNLGIPYLSPKITMRMDNMQMSRMKMQSSYMKSVPLSRGCMMPALNMSGRQSGSSEGCSTDSCSTDNCSTDSSRK